jgi:hypothetical protein
LAEILFFDKLKKNLLLIKVKAARYVEKRQGAVSDIKFAVQDEIGVDKQAIDQEAPKFRQLLALNKPEWYLIVLGCIAACVVGSSSPVFGLIFSKMIIVYFFCTHS